MEFVWLAAAICFAIAGLIWCHTAYVVGHWFPLIAAVGCFLAAGLDGYVAYLYFTA